ncbi:DNA-3-methyladenine glycosylase [Mycoplasma sp. ATU-Cv-508]|uniref:DNA-3-methyladenine glycosylase n=1 Tax=Mycoplasma sp. ATU-Cv-508 TaxID=2048001 RepID=UPI000FDD7A02
MSRLVFLTQGLNWKCTFPSGLIYRVFQIGRKILLVKLTFGAEFVSAKALATKGGQLSQRDQNALTSQIKRWLGFGDPYLNEFHRLAVQDDWLKPILAAHRACPLVGQSDFYRALVWTIIGQQISMAAARTIFERFISTYGDKLVYQGQTYHAFPGPKLVATLKVESLTAVKISRPKAKSILKISQMMVTSQFDYRALEKVSDLEQLVSCLVALPGIGPWSAHYLAMLYFRHPDAFPAQDAGLIKAIKLLSRQQLVDEQVWKKEVRKVAGISCLRGLFLWKYLV